MLNVLHIGNFGYTELLTNKKTKKTSYTETEIHYRVQEINSQ